MTIIKTTCRTRDEFLNRYLADLPHGGLFIPTLEKFPVDLPVIVVVRVGMRSEPVLLRAFVKWSRRGKNTAKIRAGVAVAFLASEDRQCSYLLSIARGGARVVSGRKHPRLPINLPVRWTADMLMRENSGVLRDIAWGGAFVQTQEQIGNRDVILTVAAPGVEIPTPVLAKIAWISPGAGFGVSWRVRSPADKKRIKELVRRMEQTGNTHAETPTGN